MKKIILSLSLLIGLVFTSAADVTVAWDYGSVAAINGFRLYYSTNSGTFTQVNSVVIPKTQLTGTLSNLLSKTTYYFIVTAFDAVDESDASNQATVTTKMNKPQNVRINGNNSN